MTKIRIVDSGNRDQLVSLFNLRSASDAILAYYAVEHPANKVKIFADYSESAQPGGLLIVAQTGLDLFRPLVMPYVNDKETFGRLLHEALSPMQPILLSLPLEQRQWAEMFLELSNSSSSELLRLDPNSFNPVINVLVTSTQAANGFMRFEINAQSGARAVAGINWQGRSFAEVYVEADRESARRKFDASVLTALCQYLLERKLIPLMRFEESFASDFESLTQIGFISTGSRFLLGQAIRRDTP